MQLNPAQYPKWYVKHFSKEIFRYFDEQKSLEVQYLNYSDMGSVL